MKFATWIENPAVLLLDKDLQVFDTLCLNNNLNLDTLSKFFDCSKVKADKIQKTLIENKLIFNINNNYVPDNLLYNMLSMPTRYYPYFVDNELSLSVKNYAFLRLIAILQHQDKRVHLSFLQYDSELISLIQTEFNNFNNAFDNLFRFCCVGKKYKIKFNEYLRTFKYNGSEYSYEFSLNYYLNVAFQIIYDCLVVRVLNNHGFDLKPPIFVIQGEITQIKKGETINKIMNYLKSFLDNQNKIYNSNSKIFIKTKNWKLIEI